MLPSVVKHPLLAYEWWRWKARGLPAQSSRDILLFKAVLSGVGKGDIRVFEWGSGASTIYYPKYLNSIGRDFDWHAIDNSRAWYLKSQERIAEARLDGFVHVYYSEFPAFWEFSGYTLADPIPPDSEIDYQAVAKYVEFPKELDQRFDLVIIDGRYRRRCLITAKHVLADDGVLILHDAQRTHYHSSLSEFGQVEWLDTGLMPGTKQLIKVALCSVKYNPSLSRLVEEFSARV